MDSTALETKSFLCQHKQVSRFIETGGFAWLIEPIVILITVGYYMYKAYLIVSQPPPPPPKKKKNQNKTVVKKY